VPRWFVNDSLLAGAVPTGTLTENSESALIAAAQGGDSLAYGELCRRHSGRVFRTVLRILGNAADAEDVVQEALLAAFANISNFAQKSAFSTWLTRIAINFALLLLRRRSTEVRTAARDIPDDSLFYDVAEPSPSPEDVARHMELSHAVLKAITQLPPTLQGVIHIRCFQEASTKETAAELGLSERAVRVRLHRARSTLRQRLSSVL
jgi:RNA polymerase sigma-70 factor, ECF subfamily